MKPERRPVKRVVEQPGTVQAFEETALHAKLPGFVEAVEDDPDKKDRPPHDRQIDIGSRVKKGQVLAELAVPELEEELKQKDGAGQAGRGRGRAGREGARPRPRPAVASAEAHGGRGRGRA